MNLIFKKAKILIVEDEKIIAKDIESTLKRIGGMNLPEQFQKAKMLLN